MRPALTSTLDRLARRYARVCPHADRRDLEQVGRVVDLELDAAGKRDSSAAYRVVVLRRALRAEAWRAELPVSTPRVDSRFRLRDLRQQCQRASDDVVNLGGGEEHPDHTLDLYALRCRVRRRLAEHLQRSPWLEPGIEVLEGGRARQVAARRGVQVEHIYRVTSMLKQRLRRDGEMQLLWSEYRES